LLRSCHSRVLLSPNQRMPALGSGAAGAAAGRGLGSGTAAAAPWRPSLSIVRLRLSPWPLPRAESALGARPRLSAWRTLGAWSRLGASPRLWAGSRLGAWPRLGAWAGAAWRLPLRRRGWRHACVAAARSHQRLRPTHGGLCCNGCRCRRGGRVLRWAVHSIGRVSTAIARRARVALGARRRQRRARRASSAAPARACARPPLRQHEPNRRRCRMQSREHHVRPGWRAAEPAERGSRRRERGWASACGLGCVHAGCDEGWSKSARSAGCAAAVGALPSLSLRREQRVVT
jgi:hypothetical protein